MSSRSGATLYEKIRWVAQSLYKAFVTAQGAMKNLHETAALKTHAAVADAHVEETEQLMGRDFWPYGLEPNLHSVEYVSALSL